MERKKFYPCLKCRIVGFSVVKFSVFSAECMYICVYDESEGVTWQKHISIISYNVCHLYQISGTKKSGKF